MTASLTGTPVNLKSGSGGGSTTLSGSVTVPAGCTGMTVRVSTDQGGGTARTCTGVTYNSVAMDAIAGASGTRTHAAASIGQSCWKMLSPPVGAHTLTATINLACQSIVMTVEFWIDHDATNFCANGTSAGGTADPATIAVTVGTDGVATGGCCAWNETTGTVTEGDTLIQEVFEATQEQQVYNTTRATGSTPITLDWAVTTPTGPGWLITAFEVLPAAGATGNPWYHHRHQAA